MAEITDPNMRYTDDLGVTDIQWYDCRSGLFSFYGISGDPDPEGVFTSRVPKSLSEKTGLPRQQCAMAAGGRIRFSTDSPYIAVQVTLGHFEIPSILSPQCAKGFDLYQLTEQGQEIHLGIFRVPRETERDSYAAIAHLNGRAPRALTLNFPTFAEVKELRIGLKQGSTLGPGMGHQNEGTPVVFYGSSITHGASASRPGHTYEAMISHRMNLDYVNLGFAGNAKGEEAMAEYIGSLKMQAFVCDYDHNAPNSSHLEKTHYRFYEIIRKAQPDLPYIMVSRPDTMFYPQIIPPRRDVILESYRRAKAAGDKNVYFIDGETLCRNIGREGFVDCTHPNDLGFLEMSQVIGGLLEQVLKYPRK